VLGVFFAVVTVVGVSGGMIALAPLHSHSLDDAHLDSGRTPVGRVGVLTLQAGTGLTEDGRVTGAATTFASDTPEIDLAADMSGIVSPVLVTGRLTSLKAERAVDAVPILVDKPGGVTFRFPQGDVRWPTGKWRASVLVEGKEAAFQEFNVR
jgi:hypothetical protein